MKKNDSRCLISGTDNYWTNITKRFAACATLFFALAFCSKLSAQTITVDGRPGDWPAVLASTSVAFKAYVKDPVNSKTDDVWTKGSQNTDPISGWHWTNGNTNDKTDLGNTGVAIIANKLYFFADLHANNGDAAIGFWLLKGGVAPIAGGAFTGTHQEGDILVSVLFTNGHKTATPTVYKWQSGALTLVALSPTAAGAAVNYANVPAPWPYTPKSGSIGIYPARSFFEGFVNLDSIGAASGCFLSFITETWESQSPHAALADLVAGSMGTPLKVTVANDTVCAGSSAVFATSVTGGSAPYTYVWNSGTASASGSYTVNPATVSQAITVVVTSADGCGSGRDTAQLVVRPVPSANPIGNATYCSGTAAAAINLTGPVAGTSFSWTSTSNVGFGTSGSASIPAYTALTGSVSATTTVTVTPAANGCIGAPVSFTISVNPSPVVTVLDTNLCNGTIVALTASPAGGTWAGYGVSGSTFNATTISAGVYTVSYYIFGAGGCVGAANATVTVKKCHCGCKFDNNGAETPEITTDVYPNPSTGSFVVNIPALQYDSRLTVLDLNGNVVRQEMLSKNDNNQQLSLDLSHVSRGLYFIQVQDGDKRHQYKVVLQ